MAKRHGAALAYLGIFGAACAAVGVVLHAGGSMSGWYLPVVAAGALLVIAAERRGDRPRWLDRRRYGDVLLALVNAVSINAYLLALDAGIQQGQTLWAPLGRLWPAWPLGVSVIAAFVFVDFVSYWAHRAVHRVAWSWRWHRLHHSVEHLDWLSVLRFHPFDALIMTGLAVTPLHLLGAPLDALVGAAALSQVGAFLQHADIEGPFPIVSRVFHTPDLHRWHHQRDGARATVNFGATLIVWDWIFGTRCAQTTAPALGLDEAYPRTWLERFIEPERRES